MLPEQKSYTYYELHSHTHLIFYYCQAPINYLSFHWNCLHGSGSVELSSPSCCQLHRLLVHLGRKELNSVFVHLCLIRDLSQMCPRVSLGSSRFLSLLLLWLFFYALRVPDIGRKLLGVIHVTQWCVQSWGDIPHPFWEALTLNTKGWDCLPSTGPNLSLQQDWHWPRNKQFAVGFISQFYFIFSFLCVCMGRSYFILERH